MIDSFFSNLESRDYLKIVIKLFFSDSLNFEERIKC